MTKLDTTLATVAETLDGLGRRWALVGGLAVSARAEPRFTRDIDIAVAVSDDADAERLVFSLQQRGFLVAATIEQQRAERLATIRLNAPHAVAGRRGVVVDLLFASSGIEDVVVGAAEPIDVLPGLTVPVARVGHLIAMKVLARDDKHRPQDAADVQALLREGDEDELVLTRQALELISQRGFNRGRDLLAAWRQLLADSR